MKSLSIILITSIVCLFIAIAAIKGIWFHEQRFRLQILQEQLTLVDLRCQKALHGSAATICENISTEALFELGQLPGGGVIKQLDARQLELVEAYERREISEAEKNKAVDQLQIEGTKKLDDAEASTSSQSPFDFLLSY